MPVQGATEKYRVDPKGKLKLSDHETDDKSLFTEGDKEDHEQYLIQLREELRLLQNKLYAESKNRVLVVIQAMDTGGKDGTVKSVFSKVDPQGIHVELSLIHI